MIKLENSNFKNIIILFKKIFDLNLIMYAIFIYKHIYISSSSRCIKLN